MLLDQDTIWCDGCGVEILGSPQIKEGQLYCCQECQLGSACACGERLEQEDFPRAGSPGWAPSGVSSTGQ